MKITAKDKNFSSLEDTSSLVSSLKQTLWENGKERFQLISGYLSKSLASAKVKQKMPQAAKSALLDIPATRGHRRA